MNGFWLSPSCEKHFCQHHWTVAVRIIGDINKQEANESLLRRGWIRCTIDHPELYFERRIVPTEKQMAELKDYALEQGLRCFDDKGCVAV